MPVYFIQAENGLIKIGQSGISILPARIRSIELTSPIPVALLGIILTAKSDTPFHHRFAHLRQHGEWFLPGQDLLDFIAANITQRQLVKKGRVCKGIKGNGQPCGFMVSDSGEFCRHHDPAHRKDRIGQGYYQRGKR